MYSLDDGFDFYAPQTMLAPDGRRIMIGWMQSWDSNIRPADQKWSCMMTVPRELHIEQGRILQNPVREIENYHRNAVYYQNNEIHAASYHIFPYNTPNYFHYEILLSHINPVAR